MSIFATPFPISLSKLQKQITYSTDITVGKSGHEVRNANWQDPLYEYNAASGIKSRADVATLAAFFQTVRGRETAFLLQDLDDYQIPHSGSTPQSIGTGNGVTTTFQIYKRYTNALGNAYDRIITKPSATTSHLAVYVNGVLKTHTTHYTYSTSTGIITFVTAPPNTHVVTITLSLFYVPVRFMSDKLPIDMLTMWVDSGTPTGLSELPDVGMIEVRS